MQAWVIQMMQSMGEWGFVGILLLMALENICIVAALWIAGKAWLCEGLSVLNSGLITGPIMLVSYTFRKISQKYKDGHNS